MMSSYVLIQIPLEYGKHMYVSADLVVHVTTNHLGYFSFALCPAPSPDPSTDPTPDCFDSHPLTVQASHAPRYLGEFGSEVTQRWMSAGGEIAF
jgi:hypothetical protein